MIAVVVGTNGAPFDRLLRALDHLSPGEEVVVQRGLSHVSPAGATCTRFFSFAETQELMRAARVVVTHAGVGATLAAIGEGHRPIVVPRRRAFGEAVDDHQVSFAQRLDAAGLVTCCMRPEDVRALIATSTSGSQQNGTKSRDALVADLSAYLATACGRTNGVAAAARRAPHRGAAL